MTQVHLADSKFGAAAITAMSSRIAHLVADPNVRAHAVAFVRDCGAAYGPARTAAASAVKFASVVAESWQRTR